MLFNTILMNNKTNNIIGNRITINIIYPYTMYIDNIFYSAAIIFVS